MFKSFLIIKASSIGDIIHVFPVVQYLHAKFPGCRVDWVVEKKFATLLTSHPLIAHVFFVDTYTWRKKWWHIDTWTEIFSLRSQLKHSAYDAVFDLQGNIKSTFITSCVRSHNKVGFEWKSVPEKPNVLVTNRRFPVKEDLQIQKRYLSLVQSYFTDREEFYPADVVLKLQEGEEKELQHLLQKDCSCKIMVAFGSKWKNKQLSAATLEDFLQKIESKYHPQFFFVWGNTCEKEKAETLAERFQGKSVGNLSFPMWQALMRQMHCVIAMDSAALHLCATTKTPSFSVFGPSSSSIYKPLGSQHVAFQGPCPYGKHFVRRCPILRTCPTGACMKNLGAEELFALFVGNLGSVP